MVKQFASYISIEGIICLVGTILFASWLLRTSLGRKSLADSVPRRHSMPIYLPFIPLFIWLVSVPLAILITRKFAGESASGEVKTLQDWQGVFLDNLIFCIVAIIIVLVIIFLARATFARRLKGFGLNTKTIHKDFLAAFLSLLSVWPLILAMIILTVYLGKVLFGQDYKMPRHEELQLITIHRQLPLRILIVITAVVAAPLLEEMLFRGLFQTLIRSILIKPWPSIVISSIIFTTVHEDKAHWPALFVLAICLGYTYEKSGSLLRPIFIHSFFNAITIIEVLYQL